MLITNSHLSRIIIFGMVVLLYAPLMFKIILYHFEIRGIYPLTIFIISCLALLSGMVNKSFVLAKIDILVIGFFIYVTSRFYIDGSDHPLVLFLSQGIFPYFLGRIAGNLVNHSVVAPLYWILGVAVAFIIFEFIASPASFEGDRIRLFEKNICAYQICDETAGATQHYAGSLFGASACISCMQIMMRGVASRISFEDKNIIVHYGVLLVSLVGLIFISSKTSLLITLVICLFISAKSSRIKKMVRLLTFSAVVMTLVVTVASPERIGFFTSIFSIDLDGINIQDLCFTPESGGSVLGRVSMSIDALSMWFSEPILGVGPGNFGLLDCDVNPKRDGTHPHNIFFGLLSELGLIGLLWFAAIVLIPIVKVLRIEHSLFLGQIIILFSFELGQSFFISSGYLGNFGIYLFIGIIVTSGLRSSNRRVVKEPLVKQ